MEPADKGLREEIAEPSKEAKSLQTRYFSGSAPMSSIAPHLGFRFLPFLLSSLKTVLPSSFHSSQSQQSPQEAATPVLCPAPSTDIRRLLSKRLHSLYSQGLSHRWGLVKEAIHTLSFTSSNTKGFSGGVNSKMTTAASRSGTDGLGNGHHSAEHPLQKNQQTVLWQTVSQHLQHLHCKNKDNSGWFKWEGRLLEGWWMA